jgi:hypothetical protein
LDRSTNGSLLDEPGPGMLAGNLGEPIKLTELQLNGVAGETGRGGQTIKVFTRLSLTSDDRLFHRVVEGLTGHIEDRVRAVEKNVNLTRSSYVLLVIHPDNTGELWLDTAAVSLNIMAKRPVVVGAAIFEADVADVVAMSFPLVAIGKEDRVVCVFREGWRFALFFDFNPGGELSIDRMERDLGTLYRRLKYRDLYDAIADESVFGRLTEAGWFPFVEILGREFRGLVSHCEAGFDLEEAETNLLAAFDTQRVETMFARWMAKTHFAGKERLLRSALNNFVSGDAVAALKIILTEIEGILSDAYRQIHGNSAKLETLLKFAVKSAENKAGQPDTLLLSAAFAHYLKSHTFAKFDPLTRTGKASSRHAVGHGQADADSYTQVRALQALLTLDQIAFYT